MKPVLHVAGSSSASSRWDIKRSAPKFLRASKNSNGGGNGVDYVGIGVVVRGSLLGIVVLSVVWLLMVLLLLLVVVLVADVPCLGLLDDVLFRSGTILGRPCVVSVLFA